MIIYNKFSNGGTEIQSRELSLGIPKNLLDKFQIISDETIPLDYSKIRIFWFHSTAFEMPHNHLKNNGWKKFHKLVFISHHQMENYVKKFNIPYSHCGVMHNALHPIKLHEKPENKISLIYTSTPHRGLDILVNVFEKLCEEYDNIELKVHSSYSIYEWNDVQKEYEQSDLYKRLEKHPNIKNIGYVSNDELKKSLASSHIFSYPCIWEETFCLSLLEAMNAGCLCFHPNFGCLPETVSNWTMMYPYHENKEVHKEIFYNHLKKGIEIVNTQKTQEHLKKQKEYVNYFYNWERRTQDWIDLLKSLENLNPKLPKNISFSYS